MKRILALTLAALMLIGSSALAGFVPPETPEYKHYGDVRIKMINVWNGSGTNMDKVDWYNNEVAKLIREKIGVTLEIEGIMMNETEKLNMVFASGDMPDLMDAAYWQSPSGENTVIKKAATEGMLLPIDDYFEQFPNLLDAYNVGVIAQKFKEVDVEDPIFEGKHYVLPMETPGNPNNITRWTYGLAVRGDIPGLIGIDQESVHTPDDLYNFLKAIKEAGVKDVNGNDVIPLSTQHNGWALDMAYIGFTDPYLTDASLRFQLTDEGKVDSFLLSQDYMDQVLFVRKLVAEDLLDKECFTTSDELVDTKNANGTIAVGASMFSGWVDSQKKTSILLTNPEMKFVPLGPLYYKEGTPNAQTELNGRNGSHVWIFPTTNKNLEATLAWISYANTYEGLLLRRYGIEGVSFDFNEEGYPRWQDWIIEGRANLETREATDQRLRELGVNQYGIRFRDLSMDWFGEPNPGALLDEDPNVTYFKENGFRDLRLLDGYPVDGMISTFARREEVTNLFAGEREKMARERAYFAATDEEAIAIIEEFRSYLLSGENSVLPELLEYMTEQLPARDNWLF
jgi:putative aldouronate transport system substrate-binding protein